MKEKKTSFEDIVTYSGFIVGLVIGIALYLLEYIGLFLCIAITVAGGCLIRLAFKGSKKFQESVEKRKEEERKAAESNRNFNPYTSANNTTTSKGASVVGRAVAGGIIAGGAGAVVGAISALDKNQKNNSSKEESE